MTALESLRTDGGVAIARHMEATFNTLVPQSRKHGDDRFLRLITGEAHPLGNFAFMNSVDNLEGTKDAVSALLEISEPKAVLFPGLASNEVAAHINSVGFQGPARMPLMSVEISRLSPTPVPENYELVEIDDSNETGWVQAMADGYPIPRGLAEIFAPSNCAKHGGDHVKSYGVKKDGRVVATSMLYCTNGLAGIYCVATVPEERGKGLGALVTAEPLRRSGYEVGVLQSSEMGYPVYQRLGFEDLGGMSFFVQV